MIHRLLACLLLFPGASGLAATDIGGARDLPGTQRFPGSWIIEYSAPQPRSHRLILGGLKKIDGALAPEREVRLTGELTRVTYRVPEDYALSAVQAHWQRQILGEQRDLLFQCQGRACGSSNFWANRIFEIPVLYGPDGEQRYEISREIQGDSHLFQSFYLVRRGNKRIYVHLESFRATAEEAARVSPDPLALLSLLKRQRRLVLRDVHFAEGNVQPRIDGDTLDLVAEALAGEPVLEVALVAHAYSAPGAQQNLQISRKRANNLLKLFRKKLKYPQRVQAHGVGSLAPRGGDATGIHDRVELVLP